MRALYIADIQPIVDSYFGILFRPVQQWFSHRGISLWAGQVTACTMGLNFWPHMHKDRDIWFTVLLRLHVGSHKAGGGHFAFPEMGWVLLTEAMDILIYNPDEFHGTTEMDLTGIPAGQGILYIAFYCKKDVVKGRIGTCMAQPCAIKPTVAE